MVKVAINGFGRIGRLVARAILERPESGLELVTINDLSDAKSNAWLFSRDSVHGKYPGTVEADGDDIIPGWVGNLKFAWLNGVDSAPNTNYCYWVSQNVFSMYQLMFAIITPALIVGAIAERMKFSAVMLFMLGWMFLVYFPMAHAIWGITGDMNGVWNAKAAIKAIDFAGGTVVHMTSGWSALLLCIILGPRIGFGKKAMTPHSMVLCAVGTGMLWVGWYGFNVGSIVPAALGDADFDTAQFYAETGRTFANTTIATMAAMLGWLLIERLLHGKATSLGAASGIVAGLVAITPGSGFVKPMPAIIIGLIAGVFCFFMVTAVKRMFGYDDSLDAFGVHGIGGLVGCLLTGVFATRAINDALKLPNGQPAPLGLVDGNAGQILNQGIGAIIGIAFAVVGTLIALKLTELVTPVRMSISDENEGMDIALHGEEGYVFED